MPSKRDKSTAFQEIAQALRDSGNGAAGPPFPTLPREPDKVKELPHQPARPRQLPHAPMTTTQPPNQPSASKDDIDEEC